MKGRPPIRKQRKRIKGWRMGPNSIFVGRAGKQSKYGNPYKVEAIGNGKYYIVDTLNGKTGVIIHQSKEAAVKAACQLHAFFLHQKYSTDVAMMDFLRPLVGKKILYCWCKEDQQCHADYYIYLIKKLFYGGKRCKKG